MTTFTHITRKNLTAKNITGLYGANPTDQTIHQMTRNTYAVTVEVAGQLFGASFSTNPTGVHGFKLSRFAKQVINTLDKRTIDQLEWHPLYEELDDLVAELNLLNEAA